MRKSLALVLLALFPWLAAAQQLPRTELSAGMHLIRAEVADNFVARMQGLMHRTSMGANEGMLFVFDEPGIQCMWMKNTLIPLSVAYLADDGTIVNIEDMKPQTEDSHCTRKPVRFALEMNQGWFASKGLKSGAKLRGLEKFKPR
jgi:uncharacterized membrane protein (UPF0127 family)